MYWIFFYDWVVYLHIYILYNVRSNITFIVYVLIFCWHICIVYCVYMGGRKYGIFSISVGVCLGSIYYIPISIYKWIDIRTVCYIYTYNTEYFLFILSFTYYIKWRIIRRIMTTEKTYKITEKPLLNCPIRYMCGANIALCSFSYC